MKDQLSDLTGHTTRQGGSTGEKGQRVETQLARQTLHRSQGEVPLTPLQRANVRAIHPEHVCEGLLGQVPCGSIVPQVVT